MTETNRPSQIVLENPQFPYLVQQKADEPTSYIFIQRPVHDMEDENDERVLFYVAGGSITHLSTSADARMTHMVDLRHSFATDISGDSCYVSRFGLSGLQVTAMYKDTMVFTGWLTYAGFYPEGYADDRWDNFNPFDGAKPDDGENYPYSPPGVCLGALPLPVEVFIRYNQTNVNKTLKKTMNYHAQKRKVRERNNEELR